jgi:hypothetical protein
LAPSKGDNEVSKQITMVFWRDKYEGPGCLEYSWVPEGVRHYINLRPGTQQGSSSDTIDDELNPSHVQVYVATNSGEVSIEMWQFPSGPPKASPIVSAQVLLFEGAGRIVGAAFYEDGTIAADVAKLDPNGRDCPQRPTT